MGWFGFLKPPDISKLKQEGNQRKIVKLLRNKNSTVREEAARAVGEIHAESAIPQLVKTLLDPVLNVRLAVAGALTSMNWRPSTSEEKVVWILARNRPDEAANLEESEIPLLIQATISNSIPDDLQVTATVALGEKWNDMAIDVLIMDLGIKDEQRQKAAEQSLIRIGNGAIGKLQEVVKMDIKVLKDKLSEPTRQQSEIRFLKPESIFWQWANQIKENAKKVIEKIQTENQGNLF